MSKRKHQGPQMVSNGDPAEPKGAKKKGPAAEGVALKIMWRLIWVILLIPNAWLSNPKHPNYDPVIIRTRKQAWKEHLFWSSSENQDPISTQKQKIRSFDSKMCIIVPPSAPASSQGSPRREVEAPSMTNGKSGQQKQQYLLPKKANNHMP